MCVCVCMRTCVRVCGHVYVCARVCDPHKVVYVWISGTRKLNALSCVVQAGDVCHLVNHTGITFTGFSATHCNSFCTTPRIGYLLLFSSVQIERQK